MAAMTPQGWIELVRDRALIAWASAVIRRPWVTIALCVAAALVSGAVAARWLGFQTDRSDLIDRTLPWQQRYFEYCAKFPRWDDAVVVVDTKGDPNSPLISGYLDALEARLRADTAHVKTADAGFPTAETPPGLLLGEPLARVESIANELRRAGPVVASPSLGHLLSLSVFGASAMSEGDRADLARTLRRAAAAADDPTLPLLLDVPPTQRLTTPSGSLAMVLVELTDSASESVESEKARGIAGLRAHLAALRADPRFASVEAGVTGVPVLEDDETIQSTADSSRASVIATVAIALMSIAVYRGVVIPALVIGGLLLGVAASFGWAAVSVGHLQVLSVVFMVMLVGIGEDMAMHLIARLEVLGPDRATIREKIVLAFRAVGPGVITGTLTTAAAFAATGFTEFAGVAELGVIAAGGVVICTVVSLAFLPAAFALYPRPERILASRGAGVSQPFLGGALNWVDRRAPIVAAAWAVILAGAVVPALRVRYDTDLLKLLPDNLESVRWERRLSADDERSVWHAIVVAKDGEEASRLTAALRASPLVAAVEGAGMLHPDNLAAKQAALRSIPEPPSPLAQAEALDPRPAARSLSSRFASEPLGAAAGAVASLSDDQVARLNAAYARDRGALADQVRALRAAAPPAPADLPRAIREQFIGVDGSLLIRVFPTTEGAAPGTSVLSPERLDPFMRAVMAIAPNATGPTSQIWESGRVIKSANVKAFLFAGVAIMLALLLDFRSIANALCAMIPVAVSVLLTLAAMGAGGESLNFANTIVAPLIIGLGVTAGVNAVHRWRQQPFDPPAGLAGGAGRAITLTLATTAIGFAAMMTADHRGIRSLGLLMTIGLAAVWVSTVFLLPAVLRLRSRPHYDAGESAGRRDSALAASGQSPIAADADGTLGRKSEM